MNIFSKKFVFAVALLGVLVTGSKGYSYQASVITLTRELITIEINANDKVEDVKQKVFNQKKIPIEAQILIYAGLFCENHKLVEEYSPNDFRAHLLVRFSLSESPILKDLENSFNEIDEELAVYKKYLMEEGVIPTKDDLTDLLKEKEKKDAAGDLTTELKGFTAKLDGFIEKIAIEKSKTLAEEKKVKEDSKILVANYFENKKDYIDNFKERIKEKKATIKTLLFRIRKLGVGDGEGLKEQIKRLENALEKVIQNIFEKHENLVSKSGLFELRVGNLKRKINQKNEALKIVAEIAGMKDRAIGLKEKELL